MKNNKPVRVALYARVSTTLDEKGITDQDGERVKKQNPEVQLEPLRRFAENHEYEIVNEFVDRASGSDSNRPALQKMLKDAFAKEFDVILIVRIDRIMRSITNLHEILNDLESWNIKLVAIEQQLDFSTAIGKLMITIIGALAEWESEIMSERIKEGIKHAQEHGTKTGNPIGRPPKFTDDDLELAKELIMETPEISWSELERQTGVNRRTLGRRFKPLKKALLMTGQNTCYDHPS